MDEQGYVKVKAGTPETNVEGVFAAGDVQDKEWRQVCVRALFDVQQYQRAVYSRGGRFCCCLKLGFFVFLCGEGTASSNLLQNQL